MANDRPRLSFPRRGPDGALTRRELLGRCTLGVGAFALGDLMNRALGAEDAATPLAPRPPQFPARAKRMIHIFPNGGASHVDTFDPKPALQKYAGKPLPTGNLRTERKTGAAFPSPFTFARCGQSGLEISNAFPKLREHADELCVIRSLHTEVPNHEPSLLMMNCGDIRFSRPSMGSWLTYGLGSENQNLPGFVALCPGGYPIQESQNWQSAFLPGAYQGTFVDSQHTELPRLIENIRNESEATKEQREQLDLLMELNRRHQERRREEAALEARIQSFELAFRMQMEAADAFDVGKEPKSILDLYGPGTQARQMLLARRLLERGVRFVQVWAGAGQPWDNHDKIQENVSKLAGASDRPIAALLQDLKQRGMLEDTLVLWAGEFGRTPTAELPAATGRDHNPYGFTVWIAGGGVRGGMAFGATDEFGFKAEENRVHVHDLHATILNLFGFDHEKFTYRYAGRDFRLTDVHGKVVREVIA
jgi:hypothetical protein